MNDIMIRMIAHNLLVDDPDKERENPYLCPGRMPEAQLRKLPPTIVYTSEFDFLRRDAIHFIDRLRAADRLLDYYSHPGEGHNYYGSMEDYRYTHE